MVAIDRLRFDNIPHVPSAALGSGEVTLQSLTAAYATFANGGQLPQPFLIRRVVTPQRDSDHDGRRRRS